MRYEPERDRFNAIDREQLAAQIVAIMDAHFQRPSPEEKRHILRLADGQIEARLITAVCAGDRA